MTNSEFGDHKSNPRLLQRVHVQYIHSTNCVLCYAWHFPRNHDIGFVPHGTWNPFTLAMLHKILCISVFGAVHPHGARLLQGGRDRFEVPSQVARIPIRDVKLSVRGGIREDTRDLPVCSWVSIGITLYILYKNIVCEY